MLLEARLLRVDLSYPNCCLQIFFKIFVGQTMMVSSLPLFGVMGTSLMSKTQGSVAT